MISRTTVKRAVHAQLLTREFHELETEFIGSVPRHKPTCCRVLRCRDRSPVARMCCAVAASDHQCPRRDACLSCPPRTLSVPCCSSCTQSGHTFTNDKRYYQDSKKTEKHTRQVMVMMRVTGKRCRRLLVRIPQKALVLKQEGHTTRVKNIIVGVTYFSWMSTFSSKRFILFWHFFIMSTSCVTSSETTTVVHWTCHCDIHFVSKKFPPLNSL